MEVINMTPQEKFDNMIINLTKCINYKKRMNENTFIITKDGKFVAECKSGAKCAKTIGVCQQTISAYLNSDKETIKGYVIVKRLKEE